LSVSEGGFYFVECDKNDDILELNAGKRIWKQEEKVTGGFTLK
jgi:hypothetical protein